MTRRVLAVGPGRHGRGVLERTTGAQTDEPKATDGRGAVPAAPREIGPAVTSRRRTRMMMRARGSTAAGATSATTILRRAPHPIMHMLMEPPARAVVGSIGRTTVLRPGPGRIGGLPAGGWATEAIGVQSVPARLESAGGRLRGSLQPARAVQAGLRASPLGRSDKQKAEEAPPPFSRMTRTRNRRGGSKEATCVRSTIQPAGPTRTTRSRMRSIPALRRAPRRAARRAGQNRAGGRSGFAGRWMKSVGEDRGQKSLKCERFGRTWMRRSTCCLSSTEPSRS